MKNHNPFSNSGSSLRYGMFIPLALIIASAITCCFSFSNAKQNIVDDLNDAMFALANENSELWTRPDTIAAIRHMQKTTHKPLIYHACDVNFKNPVLKNEVYFTLTLVDNKKESIKISGNKIVSDSIIIMSKRANDGPAIHVQGFADYSMATIFSVSDQTLPGFLLALSFISMAGMFVWKRKEIGMPETEIIAASAFRLSHG